MNTTMYKQCNLSRKTKDGTEMMTSWIRSKLAVVGNVIDKLEDTETGVMENGWTIDVVCNDEMPEQLLLRKSHVKFPSINTDKRKKLNEN